MELTFDEIEYSLKLFHDLKYNNRDFNFSEIPKIVDEMYRLELWVDKLEREKSIEVERSYKISRLMEQYFRTDFLKWLDNKSINDYIESKGYFPFDAQIEISLFHYQKNTENDFYLQWLKKEFKHINGLKKLQGYNEDKVIKDIPIECYREPKIYLFLKKYFISKLEFIVSKLHIVIKLGGLKATINKSTQTKPNKLSKEEIINEPNRLIPPVSIEEVYNFFEVLVNTQNNKGEFYLTKQKLMTFIKCTFIDNNPILQDFDVQFSKDKIDVRSVFRKFQINCSLREKNSKHLKQKYYGILVNSFTGFNQTDFDKWHVTNNKIPIPKKQKSK